MNFSNLALKLRKTPLHYFVIGIYIIIAGLFTWPYLVSPLTTMTAQVGGDEGNSVIKFESIKREGLNPFSDSRLNSIAVPDGLPTNVGVDRASFFSTLYLWLVTLAANAVFAHSLEAFLGYVLSAFVMFLFVRKITKSNKAAFVSGLIFGFCPTNVLFTISSPTYSHLWVLLLPVWAFWYLVEKGISRKTILLSAFSILPAMFWTPYYAFYALLISLASLCVAAFLLKDKYAKKTLAKFLALFALIWLLLSAAYYFIGMSAQGAESVPIRTLQEAYEQSANPIMYFLPGPFSPWGAGLHEWFTVKFIPRAYPITLYIGFVAFALAVYGFMSARKSKNNRIRTAAFFAAAISITGFIFSLTPTYTFGPLTIPTPNLAVVHLVPALRAGQRLVVLVILGVAILAGIGLLELLKKAKTKRIGLIIFGGVTLIISLEMLILPTPMATTLIQHPSLKELSKEPAGITAHYVRSSLVSKPGQEICLPQMQHRMPLVNDCEINRDWYNPNVPSPSLIPIIAVPLCEQPKALKRLNVRYVITEKTDTEINGCMDRLGSKIIIQDEKYLIYQI